MRDRILQRIHPALKLIESDVYGMAKRVREYDRSLFLVFNTKRQKYEIHSLDNRGDTFCATIPYDKLDSRIMTIIRQGDVRTRGDEIWNEMEMENRRLEKQKDEYYRGERIAMIKDTQSLFSKAAWK